MEISDAAYELMLRYYLRSRQLHDAGFLPAAMNVLMKLSLGFARLSLREREVSENDAIMAIKFYEEHVMALGEPGLFGATRISNLVEEGQRCASVVQQNVKNMQRFCEQLRNFINLN